MTKKLEELFNLPTEDSTPEETRSIIEHNRELIHDVDIAIDKIDAALPGVKDLETGDAELDDPLLRVIIVASTVVAYFPKHNKKKSTKIDFPFPPLPVQI